MVGSRVILLANIALHSNTAVSSTSMICPNLSGRVKSHASETSRLPRPKTGIAERKKYAKKRQEYSNLRSKSRYHIQYLPNSLPSMPIPHSPARLNPPFLYHHTTPSPTPRYSFVPSPPSL
ncbi:hypothetical protein HBI56_036790 [Parastagonospora nodorum]|nr:hypothetical protein HBH51_001670 [Parastagonospora nodorum]KAH4056117.1 hypothetical protein HBH49_049340 [Parastagonospora nodorum]KAH4109665.1 hypothetical protein HBH46_030410 [Parastagonospora nodorum]KAH4168217.1 hypothetical protein HBH43_121000 [Parastagonospora nodorum]KAH4309692.1 hypothetical protein HBI01_038300 [Parastagonospora nodorum]